MTPFGVLYIYVSLTICKSSHSQYETGGKAAVKYTADKSTQQQNNQFLHELMSIQKVYAHTDDFIFTLFKLNKI